MESSDGDKPTATDAAESVLGLDCDEDTLSEREFVRGRRGPDLANGGGNDAPSSSSSAGSKRKHNSLASNQVELNVPGVSSSSSGDSTWSVDGLDDRNPFALSRNKDDHSERSVTSAGAAVVRQPRGVLRLRKLAQNASTDSWTGNRNAPRSNGVLTSTQLPRNRRGILSALKDDRVGGHEPVSCLKTENASHDQDSSTNVCPETEFSAEKESHHSGEASKSVHVDKQCCRHVSGSDSVSLEENAARMLCSLSDNRCAGPAKKNTRSLDRSLSRSFHQRSNYFKNSCKENKDVASPSRSLRKRDDKVPFRKRRPRRHFYEVSPHDVDPFCIVKERIRVFWPLDETWYFGLVKEYDPATRLHHVRYDDKDEEWINLQNERIKLLLLPDEARRSNFNNSRSAIKLNHEEIEREDSDESNARSSELEPISSLSPLTKQGRSDTSNNINKQDETHSNIARLGGQKQCQEPGIKGAKIFDDATRDSSPANRGAEVLNNVRKTPEDMRFRFVYSRKRLCRKRNGFRNISEQDFCPKIVSSSAMLFPALSGRVSDSRADASLTFVSLVLNLPLKPVHKFICEACDIWLSNAFFLLQFGTLVALWPVVHLDILFVDNVLGLKHLLLETCLRSAVSFFCFLVGNFNQCSRQSSLKDSKMPCTSIRFQISGMHGKNLVFMIFSFIAMGGSKWKQLFGKLPDHCSTWASSNGDSNYTNYTNIIHHTNGTSRRVLPKIGLFAKGLDIWDTRLLGGSNCSDISPIICYFSERSEFAQNDLDLTAEPSLLLHHHLKLLTEDNLTNASQTSVSFTLNEDKQQPEEQHTSEPFHQSRPASGVCPLNLSSSDDLLDLGTGLSKNLYSPASQEFNTAETTLSSECNGGSIGEDNPTYRNFPEQNGPYFGTDRPFPSKLNVIFTSQKSEGRHLSIKIPQPKTPDASSDKSLNKDENDTQPVSNLVQELNEYPIGRSTPTAPRTTYHRNRFTSISRTFGDGSKLLPEELTLTGGSKRPRSQVSYSVSPGSEEFVLKHKSHFRKIQSHSTAKTNDAKRFTDNSRSGHSSPESLTCVANVLVTVGDRGWREYDTQITMDSDGQSERRICVKLAEGTKYAHKVCQVLQPGATNRYTHAMIWKGGAEWCLEFPDRSQWSIFKQMHDECYSYNIRAASVKNIPIPGVCFVEDDDNVAISFVRSQDYLGHIGTDVEIALDDSRVIYDMDSDDESWISSCGKSLGENIAAHKSTEDIFERVMDKLEKFAYSHNSTELTIDQMKELDIDNVSLDIIKGIHAYWKDKRQKKGMPLIRHFQSAMWKIYEQQLHDWESTVYRMQDTNGYQEKKLPAKPALFAFCLRPRGLQITNKGPKQRSHKKLMSSGCHSFSREQEGFYRAGRRCNEYVGDGRTCELYDSGSLYSPTGYSPRFSMRTDSPRSFDASERSSTPRYFRTSSSKRGAGFAFSEDHQSSPSFRHQKAKRGAHDHWYSAVQELQNTKHLVPGASQSHNIDIEELKLRDAASAAQHAVTMAKLKREKAHCLMYKADLALHKATVALVIADAIKSSRDGRRDSRDNEH